MRAEKFRCRVGAAVDPVVASGDGRRGGDPGEGDAGDGTGPEVTAAAEGCVGYDPANLTIEQSGDASSAVPTASAPPTSLPPSGGPPSSDPPTPAPPLTVAAEATVTCTRSSRYRLRVVATVAGGLVAPGSQPARGGEVTMTVTGGTMTGQVEQVAVATVTWRVTVVDADGRRAGAGPYPVTNPCPPPG